MVVEDDQPLIIITLFTPGQGEMEIVGYKLHILVHFSRLSHCKKGEFLEIIGIDTRSK